MPAKDQPHHRALANNEPRHESNTTDIETLRAAIEVFLDDAALKEVAEGLAKAADTALEHVQKFTKALLKDPSMKQLVSEIFDEAMREAARRAKDERKTLRLVDNSVPAWARANSVPRIAVPSHRRALLDGLGDMIEIFADPEPMIDVVAPRDSKQSPPSPGAALREKRKRRGPRGSTDRQTT